MRCSPFWLYTSARRGCPCRPRSRLSHSDEPSGLFRQPQLRLICLLATAGFDFGLYLHELPSFLVVHQGP